jgi:hypothetical protein
MHILGNITTAYGAAVAGVLALNIDYVHYHH